MILWTVLKMNGTYDGDKCRLKRSVKMSDYNNFTPPPGHIKALLTIEQYEELKFSFNKENAIGEKHLNVITMQIEDLPEQEKELIKAGRHQNYRERLLPNGDTERVSFTDPKNIDWTNSEIIPKP